MTEKQRRVLNYIEEFIDHEGYSPSLQEIADGLKLRSISTVHKHVNALFFTGELVKVSGKSRSLALPMAVGANRFVFHGAERIWDTVLKCFWVKEQDKI